MRPTSKKVIRGTLWSVTAIVLIACALLLRLVWISDPGKAASVQFQGFVLLPKGALLTVLDYLTVSGQLLFVTDESTGSVYKVALHERASVTTLLSVNHPGQPPNQIPSYTTVRPERGSQRSSAR